MAAAEKGERGNNVLEAVKVADVVAGDVPVGFRRASAIH